MNIKYWLMSFLVVTAGVHGASALTPAEKGISSFHLEVSPFVDSYLSSIEAANKNIQQCTGTALKLRQKLIKQQQAQAKQGVHSIVAQYKTDKDPITQFLNSKKQAIYERDKEAAFLQGALDSFKNTNDLIFPAWFETDQDRMDILKIFIINQRQVIKTLRASLKPCIESKKKYHNDFFPILSTREAALVNQWKTLMDTYFNGVPVTHVSEGDGGGAYLIPSNMVLPPVEIARLIPWTSVDVLAPLIKHSVNTPVAQDAKMVAQLIRQIDNSNAGTHENEHFVDRFSPSNVADASVSDIQASSIQDFTCVNDVPVVFPDGHVVYSPSVTGLPLSMGKDLSESI